MNIQIDYCGFAHQIPAVCSIEQQITALCRMFGEIFSSQFNMLQVTQIELTRIS